MANDEQLSLLRKKVSDWNQWRAENPNIQINLSSADLRSLNLNYANLSLVNLHNAAISNAKLHFANFINANLKDTDISYSDLSMANLNGANLSNSYLCNSYLGAAKLSNATLNWADLSDANLSNAVLTNANLEFATLNRTKLHFTNLSGANLRNVDFSDADLSTTDFSRLDLSGASFVRADLYGTCFKHTNLSGANLYMSRALYTNFVEATLTGACIADWHIGSSTKLDNVKCDYIYRARDKNGQYSSRLPVDPNRPFSPGEFELWASVRANALETIDLTFTEGFKWQDFFNSLQEVRSQNPDTGIFLQGVEERSGQYVIRLRIETDKTGDNRTILEAKIETTTKELVETKRRLHESHGEIKALDRSLEKALRMATDQGPKYNLQGAQFAGGFAETVLGNQIGGVINNYGSNADDIVRLLSSLSELSQAFPDAQKQQVQVHLEDLATDLKQPEKCSPVRLTTRIASLFGVLLLLGGRIAAATDFANNVLELSTKLNVPAEAFQPQLQQLKQIYPNFDWHS